MPLLSFRSARLGHGHGGLEQVPVHRQLEGPALELRQAAGDGQPQPGALGGPGLVPPDEALHQPLRRHVQRVPGDVLDGQGHLPLPPDQLQIDACPLHGIFGTVAQ